MGWQALAPGVGRPPTHHLAVSSRSPTFWRLGCDEVILMVDPLSNAPVAAVEAMAAVNKTVSGM